MEKIFAVIFTVGVLIAFPLAVVDYYTDFTGWQAAEQAKQQARLERMRERQARKQAFDEQVAGETEAQAAKRRLRFLGHMEDEVERLTK